MGVASQYPPTSAQPVVTSTQTLTATSTANSIATGSSTETLEAELESLLTLFNSLLAQAKARGIALPPAAGTENPFASTLSFGMAGPEITRLQEFLAEDSSLYPQGKVTGYFGMLTALAVERFQKKYGIVSSGTPTTTGYGSVGPKTRAELNNLIDAGSTP